MNIDGLSLSVLIVELNKILANSRVERIFQVDKHTLIFWLRQPGDTYRLLVSVNPENPRILISESAPDNPATPPAFCMLLRKHLSDVRLSQISQYQLDRIVLLTFDYRTESGLIDSKTIYLELMGKHSNIIFTHNGVIIDAIKRIGINISRFRQVLPGKEYSFPPGQDRLNPLTTPSTVFINSIKSKSGDLAKAIISTGIGIGPISAKELIWRAGLPDKIKLESLEECDWTSLSNAWESMIEPLIVGTSTPCVVTDSQNGLLAIAAFQLEHMQAAQYTVQSFATMNAAVVLAAGLGKGIANPEKSLLIKLVQGELARLTRKTATLNEEFTLANSADAFRKNGDIIMASLHAIPEFTESISLQDIYSNEMETFVTIELDPHISPAANAQAYYAKYNKLKRAQELISQQIQQCQDELTYLESVAISLEYTDTSSDLNDIRQELIANNYINAPSKKKPPVAPSAPLSLRISEGATILVGKNNRQNDIVTFKLSNSEDLWFHTKDIPGSHVILRTENRQPTDTELLSAASLAAYFSKARNSSSIPVDYTARKYVKKPSGSKPGFVIYDHQKTVFVTPDEQLIKQLLVE